VADAYVYAVADAYFGEAVAAAVRRAPGRTTGTAELIAWCASDLAKFKIRAHVRFVEEIPDDRVRKDTKVQAQGGA